MAGWFLFRRDRLIVSQTSPAGRFTGPQPRRDGAMYGLAKIMCFIQAASEALMSELRWAPLGEQRWLCVLGNAVAEGPVFLLHLDKVDENVLTSKVYARV
jgi:hypothetical protein